MSIQVQHRERIERRRKILKGNLSQHTTQQSMLVFWLYRMLLFRYIKHLIISLFQIYNCKRECLKHVLLQKKKTKKWTKSRGCKAQEERKYQLKWRRWQTVWRRCIVRLHLIGSVLAKLLFSNLFSSNHVSFENRENRIKNNDEDWNEGRMEMGCECVWK